VKLTLLPIARLAPGWDDARMWGFWRAAAALGADRIPAWMFFARVPEAFFRMIHR
jgi:hypothetical protein